MDRVEIQQRLGRMLAAAVTRVDDGHRAVSGGAFRGPDLVVTQRDHVRVVFAQDADGVLEALALDGRGKLACVLRGHHAHSKVLGRRAEGHPRPGGRLVEDAEQGLPSMKSGQRELLGRDGHPPAEFIRAAKQPVQDRAVELLGIQYMSHCLGCFLSGRAGVGRD